MWKKGRQGTGYARLTLLATSWLDCHILRYLPGEFIPPHTDKLVDGSRHYRMNILLKGEDSFQCSKVLFKWWRVVIFRPDLHEHAVPAVTRKRYMLSIGWAR